MKVSLVASTKLGYQMPIEDANKLSGIEAGICYMPDTMDALLAQDTEKHLKRANGTRASGHHSVMGHAKFNFIIEDAPKIVAMVLNNEHVYDTSEKSARYTKMRASGLELELYEKWIEKFDEQIYMVYPQIDEKTRDKLAKENARYFISVFTPATTMGYSVDFRQAQYLVHWMRKFVADGPANDFAERLKPWLAELADEMAKYVGGELDDGKGRGLSLFASHSRHDEWGENYCTTYKGSFAQLAQAHRHRTLRYEMKMPDNFGQEEFFVPPIIRGTVFEAEYLADMKMAAANYRYPQGMLVTINERGTWEDFTLKCKERLCGAAQLEICLQTQKTLTNYRAAIQQAVNSQPSKFYLDYIDNALFDYDGIPKCQQAGGFKCTRPCPLGANQAFKRLI